jgi:antitoxin component YwqK of YwqJK toxin-antitoxin module
MKWSNMKKTLLILSTLLLLSANSYGVESKEIDSVQLKDGLAYEKGQDTPFTGIHISRDKDGNKFHTKNYLNGVLTLMTVWYEDGTKLSEAEHKNGKANGHLLSWHKNGNMWIKSDFKDDKENGTSTIYYKNGQKKQISIFDNGKILESTHWDEDGDKVRNVKYDGLSDLYKGQSFNPIAQTRWYKNGQKKGVVHYRNKVKNGLFTKWYENGKLKSTTNFVNGKVHGLKSEWYDSGKIKSEINYSNNKVDGLITKYHPNGQKEAEIHMKNNVKGLAILWDKDGKKIFETDMSNK